MCGAFSIQLDKLPVPCVERHRGGRCNCDGPHSRQRSALKAVALLSRTRWNRDWDNYNYTVLDNPQRAVYDHCINAYGPRHQFMGECGRPAHARGGCCCC